MPGLVPPLRTRSARACENPAGKSLAPRPSGAVAVHAVQLAGRVQLKIAWQFTRDAMKKR